MIGLCIPYAEFHTSGVAARCVNDGIELRIYEDLTIGSIKKACPVPPFKSPICITASQSCQGRNSKFTHTCAPPDISGGNKKRLQLLIILYGHGASASAGAGRAYVGGSDISYLWARQGQYLSGWQCQPACSSN
eukprot:6173141-Pleurochrysis_carterae.AAC.1